jgi:hypothetical protein
VQTHLSSTWIVPSSSGQRNLDFRLTTSGVDESHLSFAMLLAALISITHPVSGNQPKATRAVRLLNTTALDVGHAASQAAQESVLASSEQGVSAANLYAGRRVRTLINAPTGQSAGVITTAQLDSLIPKLAGGDSFKTDLSLSADQISDLRRRTEPGLTFTLRRILGKASDLRLALSP